MSVAVEPGSVPTLHLPATPDAPAAAREYVRAFCRDCGIPHACDTAALLLTELVGNSVRHARSEVTVGLRLDQHFLRLRVSDRSVAEPRQRTAGLLDEGGRGMLLVDALAAAWGVKVEGDGKTVWAEIAL